MRSSVLVILPTLNEVDSIGGVLDGLKRLENPPAVLIVDDGSTDGTIPVARDLSRCGQEIHLLERSAVKGLGSAYREGFRWCVAQGYEICVTMDADYSHDPRQVPQLVSAVREGVDLAIGSRYVPGGRIERWGAHRRALSRFGRLYARWILGLPMEDPTSGFKAIRVSALSRLPWPETTSDGYAFQIELHLLTWNAGCRWTEVPINFTDRRFGHTKMNGRIALEAAWRVPLLALRSRRSRPRIREGPVERTATDVTGRG